MKSLVVYYSLEGHTRYIAGLIAAQTGADIYELKPVKETPKSGFGKYFWGGKSVVFNEKPKLAAPLPDISGYEVIFIGTPVWASSFAPPVNTFLSSGSLSGKKVMLFASSAGGDAGKCFEKLKSRLTGNKILGALGFTEPTPDGSDSHAAQVKSWLSDAGM